MLRKILATAAILLCLSAGRNVQGFPTSADFKHFVNDFAETLVYLVSKPTRFVDWGMYAFGGIQIGNSYGPGQERDLFDEGFRLQASGDFKQAYELFVEAWRLYNETERLGIHHSIQDISILDYVQYTAYKMENWQVALDVCNYILSHLTLSKFDRDRFEANVRIYEQEVLSLYLKDHAADLESQPVEVQMESAKQLESTKQYDYCRDEYAKESALELAKNPRIKCRLDRRGNNPLLMYAPIKEEILSLEPVVAVLVYDLITASEIERLRAMAKAKLSTAGVVSKTHGTDYALHQRRAKTAWLDSVIMPELTKRLEVVTGMNANDGDGCEQYQIGHYGIGGHYSPHYDYLQEAAGEEAGDRIATLLLYLSEVEEGGGTVFADLKVRVDATLGAGLIWYNLHKNESLNTMTLHGGCPVLRGEKWVANKWFRVRGQIHHKPCGLTVEEPFRLRDFYVKSKK